MDALIRSPGALARAVRDARKQRGLTQQQLAARARVGQPTLSNLERGRTQVSLRTLLRILAALDLDLLLRDRLRTTPTDPWEEA